MMGKRLDDGSYDGTICQILKLGNLKVKVMVPSGEVDISAKELLGSKVLGYYWDATSDGCDSVSEYFRQSEEDEAQT